MHLLFYPKQMNSSHIEHMQGRFHLSFDEFFSSMHLINELEVRGIFGTGTIRNNRTMKCPVSSVTAMQVIKREKYDFRLEKDTGIVVCRWYDNNVVTIVWQSSQTVFLEKEKTRLCDAIKFNNRSQFFMGGVDHSDQNISLYRVSVRGKEWYFPLTETPGSWDEKRVTLINSNLEGL